MKRFTDAGRKAVEQDNLYCALTLALAIPDICGSLEDPGPGKSKQRYTRWFEKWALPKFSVTHRGNTNPTVFISADDCFQLRCSLIHSGSVEIEQGKGSVLDRFVFCDKTVGSHLNRFQDNVINGVKMSFLQLKVDKFSETMYDAADEWDKALAGDQAVQSEKAKLLVIQTKDFTVGGNAIKFG
jgi:hypothetical protein